MVTGFLVGLSAITLTFGPSALADPSDQDGFNLVTRPTLTLMAVSATGFLVRPMTPLVVGRGTPELVTRPTTPRGLELVARRPVTAGACTPAEQLGTAEFHLKDKQQQQQQHREDSAGCGHCLALGAPWCQQSSSTVNLLLARISPAANSPPRPSRAQLEESLRRPSSFWCPKMS